MFRIEGILKNTSRFIIFIYLFLFEVCVCVCVCVCVRVRVHVYHSVPVPWSREGECSTGHVWKSKENLHNWFFFYYMGTRYQTQMVEPGGKHIH